ncbi:hypothetical protein GGS26DRAFT_557577 [Hypomontagnella submonticulosa]|nr:hypothetical protein GGS26DRAFT_557577 [Hypomontagnella submonticulosa]
MLDYLRTPTYVPGLGRPGNDSPYSTSISITHDLKYKDFVEDHSQFAHHWEKTVVPYLVPELLKHASDGFSVNVVRGTTGDQKVVVIMTASDIDELQQHVFQTGIMEALPRRFWPELVFRFARGVITRSARGDDPVCPAKNPYWYPEPMMGDSVGVSHQQNGGTLGPMLQIGGQGYWVVNCHILDTTIENKVDPNHIKLHQPNHDDYDRYRELYESAFGIPPAINELGGLVALSGAPYKTTRLSLHQFGSEEHKVVTDWAIFRAEELKKNQMRVGREEVESLDNICIGSHPVPGEKIISSGRTSGFTEACISLTPAIVHPFTLGSVPLTSQVEALRRGNGTGDVTREWAVSYPWEPSQDPSGYSDWIESGVGVPGDSGAPIVDPTGQRFYGQVWGRNEYSDSELVSRNEGRSIGFVHYPRIAYFTSYHDLCDDIQEVTKSQTKPSLPNEESIRRPAEDRPRALLNIPMRSGSKAPPKMPQQLPERIKKLLYATKPSVNNTLGDRVLPIAVPA